MSDTATLKITSPAFLNMASIPSKYTCEGENVNPALDINGVPSNAKSIALIVDDPDAPGKTWVHWVMWNIPVGSSIKEKTAPGVQGITDFRKIQYGGPCPPSGTHRYFFKVYALDTMLSLKEGSTKQQLEEAMSGHILSSGEVVGLYKRANLK